MHRTAAKAIQAAAFLLLTPLCAQALSTRPYIDDTGHPAYNYHGLAMDGGDFNGDGYGDLAVGVPTFDGIVVVYFGGPTHGEYYDLVLYSPSAAQSQFGISVANAGDFNGDGYEDILVGDPFDSATGSIRGSAHVFYGGPDIDGTADWTRNGYATFDRMGSDVDGAGDMNGDGYDDIILGQPGYLDVGRASIYLGSSSPNTIANAHFPGTANSTTYAEAVAGVGDINGDGFSDIAIGFPDDVVIRVHFGQRSIANSVVDISLYAGEVSSIAGGGDIDGDGYDDILIGDPGANADFGACILWSGGPDIAAMEQVSIFGVGPDHRFGYSVAIVGDVNRDGFDDFMVGGPELPHGSEASAGRADLFLGGSTMPDTPVESFLGTHSTASLGFSVAGPGDMNGDGFADIAYGVPGDNELGELVGRAVVQSVFTYEILSPVEGTRLVAGRPATVRWRGDDLTDIYTSTNGGASWTPALSRVGGDPYNEAAIPVPGVATDAARVRLTYSGYSSKQSNSRTSAPIRIVEPTIPPAIASRIAGSPSGQNSGSEFGYTICNAGDLNADSHDDFVVGAPLDTAGGVDAGAAFVYFGGPDYDDASDLVVVGSSGDEMGTGVGSADVNADGHPDLLVSSPEDGNGVMSVYFGGPGFDDIADLIFADGPDDRYGTTVGSAGDFNGDGYEDIAASTPSDDSVWIYFAGPSVDTGVDVDHQMESFIAAGDVNKDGFDDLVGPCPPDAFRILFGARVSNDVEFLDLDQPFPGDGFGEAFGAGGDLNGDGHDDFVVGARLDDHGGNDAGRAYVFFGSPEFRKQPELVIEGLSGYELGSTIAIHPDVNGDGYADVVIGSPSSDEGGVDAGRIDVYFGSPQMDGVADITIRGATGERLGERIAAGGDHVSDGFEDVLTGRYSTGNGTVDLFDTNRFHLESPSAEDVWNVGDVVDVAWKGSEIANLELSLDGGASFQSLVSNVGGEPSNQVQVRVPHLPTRFAELRLTPSDPDVSGSDMTDGSFTVSATIEVLQFDMISEGSDQLLTWETRPGPDEGIRYTVEAKQPSNDWVTVVSATSETSTRLARTEVRAIRLTAENGLGERFLLEDRPLRVPSLLAIGPSPWRYGPLEIGFLALGLPGQREAIRIGIHDVTGREVIRVADDAFEVGAHELEWSDQGELPSGMYFVRLVASGRQQTTKLLIAR